MNRFLVALFAPPALTEQTRPKFLPDETLSVPSLTLTDEQFLRGDTADGVPVTLSGELRFPNWDERLPVVVLGPVEIHREFITAAARWILAAKL